MKTTTNILRSAVISTAILILAGCKTTTAQKSTDIELFNGKNFDGWTFAVKTGGDPMQTWSVSDGLMHCTGKPLGYARTTQTYHDYTLTCVWRFAKLDPNPKVNNSGILIHIQPPDVVFPDCVQAQGLYQHQGDLILEDGAGADGYPWSGKNVTIPQNGPQNENPAGQWNTNVVVCQGSSMKLSVNGKLMNQITGCTLTSGFVGIQSEGGDIDIQRLSLQPLQ